MHNTRTIIGMGFAIQYIELALQFVTVMILARLLTPADTGLFSVAAFFMLFLHMFRDFGVVNYVIQETDLTREKIQSAFGVAIILALLVALTMMLTADLASSFYGRPELKDILHVMALSFLISPFGSLLFGIYRREMMYKAMFFIRIGSAICHGATGIVLAYQGLGAMSMAWANFASILSFGIVANLFRPHGTPLLPRFTNVGKILSFGSVASLGSAANAIGSNGSDLVIAKVIDMAAVGYFSRANGLVGLFNRLIASTLTQFVLPYFSQIRRSGADLKAPYLAALSYVTLLSWPFFGVMAVLAFPIVRVLYGTQWDVSIPIVKLLCIAGAITSMSMFAGHAMIANGQIKYATAAQLLSQPVKIIAVLLAAAFGLYGVALALIAGEVIAFAILNYCLYLTIGTRPVDLFLACRRSAVITLFSVAGPLAAAMLVPDHALWIQLGSGAVLALTGWFAGVLITRHPICLHIEETLATLGFPVAAQYHEHPGVMRYLKGFCKLLLYQSGCMGLYHRWRNRNALTVAMFHRVLPEPDRTADPQWTMQSATFRHCLLFFKKHYHVITLQQLTEAVAGGRALPPCSLLITFDDGWADTAQFALPVLDELNLSATVFVAGSVINRPAPFWQEAVYSAAVSHNPDLNQTLTELGIGLQLTPVSDDSAVRDLIRQMESCPPDLLQQLAQRLHAQSGAPAAMLNRDQLQALAARHDIGAHGFSHQPLTGVDNPGAELRQVREVLAGCGRDVHALSFPHGAYNEQVIEACRNTDYRLLFSSDPILNSAAQGTPRIFGRIAINESEITDAACRFHPFMLAFWLFSRPVSALTCRGDQQ